MPLLFFNKFTKSFRFNPLLDDEPLFRFEVIKLPWIRYSHAIIGLGSSSGIAFAQDPDDLLYSVLCLFHR